MPFLALGFLNFWFDQAAESERGDYAPSPKWVCCEDECHENIRQPAEQPRSSCDLELLVRPTVIPRHAPMFCVCNNIRRLALLTSSPTMHN
jgi:hypothetical protein